MSESRELVRLCKDKDEVLVREVKKSCGEMLSYIQKELNVPKNRHNSFGKYMYRSAEDIVEAVKKIMPEGAYLVISDEIKMLGDRFFVEATATFSYAGQVISSKGLAREPLSKKGSDESQITGAASSYARKYALNGLFLIDDSKDADSHDNRDSGAHRDNNRKDDVDHSSAKYHIPNTDQLRNSLRAVQATHGIVRKVLTYFGYAAVEDVPPDLYDKFIDKVINLGNIK